MYDIEVTTISDLVSSEEKQMWYAWQSLMTAPKVKHPLLLPYMDLVV